MNRGEQPEKPENSEGRKPDPPTHVPNEVRQLPEPQNQSPATQPPTAPWIETNNTPSEPMFFVEDEEGHRSTKEIRLPKSAKYIEFYWSMPKFPSDAKLYLVSEN